MNKDKYYLNIENFFVFMSNASVKEISLLMSTEEKNIIEITEEQYYKILEEISK